MNNHHKRVVPFLKKNKLFYIRQTFAYQLPLDTQLIIFFLFFFFRKKHKNILKSPLQQKLRKRLEDTIETKLLKTKQPKLKELKQIVSFYYKADLN